MGDLTTLVTIVLVLAVALFGMVTRLVVPLAHTLWTEQTKAAEQQVAHLVTLPLPMPRRRHAKSRFRRAA